MIADAATQGEGERGARASESNVGAAAPGRWRGARGLIGLLAAAVLVLGLLLAGQVRYAGRLEARVAELSSELEQSRQALGVYQQRIGSVRRSLEELATRVGALQELVREDSLPPWDSAPRSVADPAAAPIHGGP